MNRRNFFKFLANGAAIVGAASVLGLPEIEDTLDLDGLSSDINGVGVKAKEEVDALDALSSGGIPLEEYARGILELSSGGIPLEEYARGILDLGISMPEDGIYIYDDVFIEIGTFEIKKLQPNEKQLEALQNLGCSFDIEYWPNDNEQNKQ